jgi:K+-transporting ATPase ATPase C chain
MNRAIQSYLRPAIVLTLALTVITGILYPLLVTGVAQAIFPYQANGSIITVHGRPVGSALIGQYWTQPQYFHGRPSATLNDAGTARQPYNAASSGASNLAPTNKQLISNVQRRVAKLHRENPGVPVPVDLVTSSGSGLDPDISIAAALFQVPRIAKARHMSEATLRQFVLNHVQGRFLNIFGEPYIDVLTLNLALDQLQGK